MATNYVIHAEMRLRGGTAFERSMQRLSGRVRRLSDMLRGARSSATGLFGTLVRFSATYVGINAITNAVGSATRGMIGFAAQTERTRIGLQSIIAAVDQMPFADAGIVARQVFRQLNDDAAASVATTQDLFEIFSGIIGPVRGAGFAMERVRTLTNSTVSAATALGIDLPQATRDINAMITGVAGTDVRLFRSLRAMGLINKTTQQFNELTAKTRVDLLTTALSSFDEAAERYGRSFAGRVSTFSDLIQQLSLSFAQPAFQEIANFLGRINDSIMANREAIQAYLRVAGERFAFTLMRIFDAAEAGFMFIVNHWDVISARIEALTDTLREHGPQLAALAAGLGALSTAGRILGTVLAPIASLLSMFETGGMLSGIGGGAGAAGGAAAAEGGAAGGAAAGLGAMLGPLAVLLAAVGSVIAIVIDRWRDFVAAFQDLYPVFEAIGADLLAIGQDLWTILRPIILGVGAVLATGLGAALLAFMALLRGVAVVLRVVLDYLAGFAEAWYNNFIKPAIDGIAALGRAVARWFGSLLGVSGEGTPAVRRTSLAPIVIEREDPELAEATTPGGRPRSVVNNNFHRGSVQVRQDFREADPDRVMVRMIQAIDRQAERRVASGFAPVLTR